MNNKKILVFSHNYIAHNWLTIVKEQLELLKTSGLYEAAHQVYYCCFAEDPFDFCKFYNLVRSLDQKQKIIIINHAINDCERQTLLFMQRVVKNYTDAYLLYYHTKGVSTKFRNDLVSEKNVTSWRKMMEYFNIENWKISIQKLEEGSDICGALYGFWMSQHHQGHYFGGNFWWTHSEYFNKLPSMEERDNWMGCETLITSIAHVWHSFFPGYPGKSLYDSYFDPKNYKF